MKKNLSILLAAVLATSSLVVPAMADNDITQGEDTVASASAVAVSYASDDIKIVVNGNNIECDQAPVIIENRTLVPLRAISEAIGAKVDWNNQDKTINITSDDLELNLTVGSKEVTATNKTDTQTLTIDVPAQIINDRTMVPVRFIAEAFGTVVDWDQESKTVSISEKVEDTTQSTEETTVSDESTESTTVEQTSETTTQEVKVISSKDRDLSLKNKQDNVI